MGNLGNPQSVVVKYGAGPTCTSFADNNIKLFSEKKGHPEPMHKHCNY